MRVLNKKQKKFIDNWLETMFNDGNNVCTVDNMPTPMQEKLVKMNDHETIWQNIDRYIGDRVLERMYK